MYTKNLLWFGLLLLVINVVFYAGCKQGKDYKDAPEALRPILVAVQDSVMAERWLQAYKTDQLPPLETFPKTEQVVFQRRVRKIGQDSVIIGNPPVLPPELIATVEPFSRSPIGEYRGDYLVTDLFPERISGRLEKVQQPLDIYYRLPNKQQLPIEKGARLSLTLFEDLVKEGSFVRIVNLSKDSSNTLLLYIADGSNEPYSKTIKELGLTIEEGIAEIRACPMVPEAMFYVQLGNPDTVIVTGN